MSQRKIKIWDLENKEWISPKDFINYLWGAKHTNQELILDDDVQEGYKVLMFTGLTDKNGKEIYESDIVKYSISDTQHSVGEVKWHSQNCLFYFNGDYKGVIDISVYVPEVLGNVYENPDILS